MSTFGENWFAFVSELRKSSPSLAAILSNSAVENETDEVVEIDVYSTFHKTQLESPKFFTLVNQAALSAGLSNKKIIFKASKPSVLAQSVDKKQVDEDAISEVMALLT
ncbi:MAG: hypothetical protein LBG64_02160 [Pseudomonadales bacterium]|nr:hypothetical protein [Pseudomonadales bacterium]